MSQELQQSAPADHHGGGGPPTAADPIRLTAVLPVFVEQESVVDIADGLVDGLGPDLHEILLVVAARAPEETWAVCRGIAERLELARVVEQRENPGLGFGVRQGIAEASGTHILLMDSDGEMGVETVPRMVAELRRARADMVIGSRWMRGGGVEGYGRFKYFLNRGYQLLFRALYRTPVHDLTLGFKLCEAQLFKAMPWNSQFHDIGCETTLRPIRAGAVVSEVPTVWVRRKEGESSNPSLRNFKYVWKALAILLDPNHPKKARARV